jgi:hypothetical protein
MIVWNRPATPFPAGQTGIIEKRDPAGRARHCGPGGITGQIRPLPNSLAIVSLPNYTDDTGFSW